MNFSYMAKIQKMESIDIDDIGKCVLNCYNDLGFNWILIVNTKEGVTSIIEYGPLLEDIKVPPNNVNYCYTRLVFNEGKVIKAIDKFLNDSKKNLTQVFEISLDEAINKIRNLVDFL